VSLDLNMDLGEWIYIGLKGKEDESVVVWIKGKIVRNEGIWDENLWKLVNDKIDLINLKLL